MDDDETKNYLTQKAELIRKLIDYLKEQKSLDCNSEDVDIIESIEESLNMAFFKVLDIRDRFSENKILTQDMIKFNKTVVEFFGFIDELFSRLAQFKKTFDDYSSEESFVWNRVKNLSNKFVTILNESVMISGGEEIFDSLPDELCKYISTGEMIKDAAEIQDIKRELLTLENDAWLPSFYMAIVGPSFMGKTQTAFTLSHSLNVIYINLTVGYSEISADQLIYSPFAKISKLFSECLRKDMEIIEKTFDGMIIASVLRMGGPFLTLGLIYYLICLERPSSVEEWFLQYINISDVFITKLSVSEFQQKIKSRGINLKDSVLFIDELNSLLVTETKILRNLGRAINIPVILSSTNTVIQDLTENDNIAKMSRTSGKLLPWVKVVTRLPKATLKSIGPFIKVKHWKDSNLESSIQIFCEPNNNNLNVDLLFDHLVDSSTFLYDIEFLKKVMLFIAEQSKTNIPGLAIISFKIFIEMIVKLRAHEIKSSNNKLIWNTFLKRIQTSVLNRKRSIEFSEGLLAGAHILTFPNLDGKNDYIKDVHESNVLASSKIGDHLFFLGKPDDSIFTLSIAKNYENRNKTTYIRDGKKWKDQCYFSPISQDFIAHMIAWNCWWPQNPSLYEEDDSSLGCVYLKYLDEAFKLLWFESKAKTIRSGFVFELLSHWAICQASHIEVNGDTSGVDVTSQFVNNLQGIPGIENLTFIKMNMPDSLSSFLSQISVPYLITKGYVEDTFKSTVSQFMKLGDSFHRIGLGVAFETIYKGETSVGLIECKLWTRAVDLSLLFKYYDRACKSKCSLTYLVVRNLKSSLKEKTFEATSDVMITSDFNLNEEYCPDDYKLDNSEDEKCKSKSPFSKTDYQKLWMNPENCINIYTISPISVNKECYSYILKAFKEFENPTGVFIIVESLYQPEIEIEIEIE